MAPFWNDKVLAKKDQRFPSCLRYLKYTCLDLGNCGMNESGKPVMRYFMSEMAKDRLELFGHLVCVHVGLAYLGLAV